MKVSATLRTPRRAPFLQVVKAAIATAAAWYVGTLIFVDTPPVFAAVAAVLVVQPSVNQSLAKALERTVGVVAGVLIASVLVVLLGDATWVVVAATTLALVIAWALRMAPGTANQVALSALLVLAMSATSPSYAVDRVIETLLGAAIGIVVNLIVVPPVAIAPARDAVQALGVQIAAALDGLADALGTPHSAPELDALLAQARATRDTLARTEEAIAAGVDSLALNPRARRHRDELERMSEVVETLRPIVTQVIGMTRSFADRYDPTVCTDPTMADIIEQIRRVAHDVRLRLDRAAAPDGVADEPPALTTPLTPLTASPTHWILVGALLEDLRRIHDRLAEPLADR